eukprot:8014700-Lingulodinium_polyedra.AAC.1
MRSGKSSSVAARGRSGCAARPRACRCWLAHAIAGRRAIDAARPGRGKPSARPGGGGEAGEVLRLRLGEQVQHACVAGVHAGLAGLTPSV